jgi:predicted DNA-binding transcriptional regulator AlpA
MNTPNKPRRAPRPQVLAGSRRALRLPAVQQKMGLHRSQILEAVKGGTFPKPFPVLPGGRAIAWDEFELDQHLLTQMATRDAAPKIEPEPIPKPPTRGDAIHVDRSS